MGIEMVDAIDSTFVLSDFSNDGEGDTERGLQEVVLCGHATLAAAATLFKLYPEKAELAFITRWSGQLTATREINTDQRDTSIKMAITLPGLQPEALAQIGSTSANDGGAASKAVTTARQALAEAAPSLSVESLRRDPFIFSWGKVESCIIELEDAVELERLKVDAKILVCRREIPCRKLYTGIVTCFPPLTWQSRIGQGLLILAQLVLSASSRGRLQIRSRVFAPGCGVDEDPVVCSFAPDNVPLQLGVQICARTHNILTHGM